MKKMRNPAFETEIFYHIYNRGNNKEKIFIEPKNYNYFLELMKKYLLPIADVYSYCLLPNHFHFIIRIKDEKDLPENIVSGKTKLHQPFSNLFNTYTKAINKQYKRSGSLFQEHLKRIEIKDENYLKTLIVYVNTNSSHHDIACFKTYIHSSYRALISEKTTLLKRDEVVNLFDNKENFIFVHNSKKINLDLIRDCIFE